VRIFLNGVDKHSAYSDREMEQLPEQQAEKLMMLELGETE